MSGRHRIAYVITSYKLPDQVVRLASVLRAGSPDGSIIVHHDDRQCSLDRAALEGLDVRLLEPPSSVAWGSFSQLAMVLRCLRWALAHTDFDWLVLISGQDYPIRPVPAIEQSLRDTQADGLIIVGRCDPPPFRRTVDEFAARYYYRWRRVPGVTGSLARHANRATPLLLSRTLPTGSWVGIRVLRSPFRSGLVCHYGEDWFTLSRTAAQAVDRFVSAHPRVLRFYRTTLIPTESFIHTALANSGPLSLSRDCRRYSVWDDPHMSGPRVLRLPDLDTMLSSGADFARKFDETVDAEVLDEIDRLVHSRWDAQPVAVAPATGL